MESGVDSLVHSIFFLLMDLFILWRAFSLRKESPSQHAFSFFALSAVMLQSVASVVLGVEYSLFESSATFQLLVYFLLITLPSLSAYTAGVWLVRYFDIRSRFSTSKIKVLVAMPMLAYVVMCSVSSKTHWIFYLDGDGYHRGTLFFLQLLVPYAYVFGLCCLLVWNRVRKNDISNRDVVKFILLYAIPPVLGSCVQMVLGPKGCFSEIGISVGLVLTYVGMYMSDAEEHRRLKDLSDFNEKLQGANKQMRLLLMRGELQAKTVAETIRGGFKITRKDKKFSFKYASNQFAEMLGYTTEELLKVSGGNMAGIVNEAEMVSELSRARRKVETGEMFVMNYKVLCKDGSWKHVEERGRLIKTEGAEDEYWSVVVDKDEQVRTEEALKNVEKSRRELAEYSDIISNAGLGVWFVTLKDGQRGKMHGNSKLYELMGIDGESMTQEDVHDFLANRILPEDVPVFGAAIEKMKAGQFAEALYRWNHPTKGVIYNRCGGTAVRLPDGSFQLSGYHGDATAIVMNEQNQQEILKNALNAAEESNRAKTAFLNNMSHDIRTPMNAILGFTTLMEKDCEKPDKIKEYLAKVKTAGDFLLSLINNVLEMARIESGKFEMNEVAVNLMDSSAMTSSLFEASLKERNLTMTSVFRIEHKNVYVDVVKMREIIVNLVSNAIKYSVMGGKITVSLIERPSNREGYGSYELSVEDNGIGISADFLPRIFDAFTRERNSTESKIVGTGLGLPIVKKLVDLMGGRLTVESEEGKGSKFTLFVDHRLCSDEEMARTGGSVPQEKKTLTGNRILLAEDNDLNAEIAETLLEDAGFVVERAIDGAVCVDMLKSAEAGYYGVILMDIQMPNMDGYEAARIIRQLPDDFRKNIPIVAMTANAFEEDKRAAIEAGMNAHVPKPVDMKVLIDTLSSVLK